MNGLFHAIGSVGQPRKGKKTVASILILALIFTMVVLPIPVASASTASVTTDKQSYEPGETVKITAAGFAAYTSITLQITKPDPETGDPTGQVETKNVTSNSLGEFTYHYELTDGIYGVYQVDASDGANSASCTFVDPACPTINALQEYTDGTSITIAWTMPGGSAGSVDGYEIQQATDSAFATAVTNSTANLSYTYTGLTEGTKYYYRARSFKVLSSHTVYSEWSNVVSSTQGTGAADTTAPVAEAGGPYSGDEGAEITFDASLSSDNGTITMYEWDWNGDGIYDYTSELPTATHVWNSDGDYTVTLRVTDGGLNTHTDTANVTVNDLGPTADLFGDTTLSEGSTGSYNASASTSWPDAIVSYEWDWDYSGIFNPSADTGAVQTHLWSSSGTYTVAVRVTDSDGSTAIATLAVTVDPVVNAAPAAPTSVSASSDGTSITLSWAANTESDLAGYNVYRSTDINGPYAALNTGLVTGTSYADSSVTQYTDYYYKVRAGDTAGNESTDSIIVRGDITPPPAPSGVSASAGDASANLGWSTVSITDLGGYNVYKKETDGTYTKKNSSLINKDARAYMVTGLTNDVKAEFVLEAVDTLGNVSAKSNVVATTPNALGLISESREVSSSNNTIEVAKDGQPRLSLTADSTVYTDTVFSINEMASVPAGATSVVHSGRAYDITPSDGTGISSTSATNNLLRVYYDDALIPAGQSEADIKVLHYTGTDWEAITPTVQDTAANYVEAPVSSFSLYAAGYVGATSTSVIESDYTKVCYTGNWQAFSGGGNSGDGMFASNVTGNYAEFTFKGVAITWLGKKDHNRGMADVYVDGVYQATIDCYAATGQPQIALFYKDGLADGVHTLKIVVASDKNVDATNSYVPVDCFEVTSYVSGMATSTKFEETGAANYTGGGWRTFVGGGNLDDAMMSSNVAGAKVTFTFTGTGITWIGKKDINRGIADVYIDGAYVTSVDAYASAGQPQVELFKATNLADSSHTLEIVNSNNKNAFSSDYYIPVDAFDVVASGGTVTRYQENGFAASALKYYGTWEIFSNTASGNNEGDMIASRTTNNYAEFDFSGTNINWIAKKDINRGIAAVYIDGVYERDVDLYYASAQSQAVVFTKTGLADGPHKIKIVVKGTKNANSQDYYVPIDYFEVIE